MNTGSGSSGVSVKSPGCQGDGLSDDAAAFQSALNRKGSIFVPAGRYLIGRPLVIHSGTCLLLDPEATVLLADGVAKTEGDYLLSNSLEESPSENISIEGGTWDGNNQGNPRPPGLFDPGCSGAMLHFQRVRHLSLKNIRLHNAEAYYARFTETDSFRVEGIRFSSNRVRPNNDGIHLGGHCANGLIRDIKGLHEGVTGDDMVALNADDALSRTEVRGMTCGPIRNITIENIEARGCHSFVRLLSVISPIENISIRNVRGSCEVAALNCDAARGCRVPVFDEANPPFPDGVGMLRNISCSGLQVAKSKDNGIPLLRLETRMENFRVADFRRLPENGGSPASPTLRLRHLAARSIRLNATVGQLAFGEEFVSAESDIENLEINCQAKEI